jgi:hypothetical protein
MNPKNIFISSTCYDLFDLRSELADYLKSNGFGVSLSDDPDSGFDVSPTVDSITSCLNNVGTCDAMVCLLDRRYGGVIPNGPYAGKSATHAEVLYARSLKPVKPVFYFVRDRSAREATLLSSNPGLKTQWIEPYEDAKRRLWCEFFNEMSRLPKNPNLSNWYDQFKDSTDLKLLVLKRLFDFFPGQSGVLALSPDRIVRLTFLQSSTMPDSIRGGFRNVGVGPALNIRHGFFIARAELGVERLGGLPEGERLTGEGCT